MVAFPQVGASRSDRGGGRLRLSRSGPVPTTPDREQLPPYEPSVSWLPIALVAGFVLAGIVAYVVSERRANRGRRSGEALAEQLAHVLDETLDDLRAEADPRRAIIAAYARLERVLAANGVARRAAETSDEYLPRVLDDLALDPRAVERLTVLFTRAKFSQHDVDTAMKEEAIGALEDVRDELRLARERPRPNPSRCPSEHGREGRCLRRGASARLPTLALLGIALVAPGRLEIAVRIYALVLCAAVIVVLLLALRRAYPDESALHQPTARASRRTPPAGLDRVEHETVLAVAGAFDLHYRLVPRLRALAAGLLSSRRSVSLADT